MRFKWITVLVLCLLLSSVFQQVTLADEAAPAQTIPLTSKGYNLKLAPDGKTLVTFENIVLHNIKEIDPTYLPMHVFDISTGKEITQLSGYSDYAADVAFARDGKSMVSIHMNGDVNVWDMATWKIVKTIQTLSMGYFLPIKLFPDNNQILLVSPGFPMRLMVLDLQTGAITHIIGKHFDTYFDFQTNYTDIPGRFDIGFAAIVLSPDGKWVATSTQNDEVGIWSVADNSYQMLREKSDKPGLFSVRQIAFMPDGKSLIYYDTSDNKTHIWDVASATEKTALAIGADNFTLSSDGTMMAWATRIKDQQSTVSVAPLDAPDKAKVLFTLPDGLQVAPRVTAVAFTPDGKQLAVGGFFADDETANKIYVLDVP